MTSERPLHRVIFDLHGVLMFRAPEVAAGLPAGEVVAALRGRGLTISFVTNSSTVGPRHIRDILVKEGIAASEAECASAGMAMARYLRTHYLGARIFLVGAPGLRQILEESLGSAAFCQPEEAADVLVVGRDAGLTAERLAEVSRIGKNAVVLATSREMTIPDAHGQLQAGPGVTVERVEEATGGRVLVIGKPNPYILREVLGLSSADLSATLIVGDSPNCDLALGQAAGAATALLSTTYAVTQATFQIERLDQLLSIPNLPGSRR